MRIERNLRVGRRSVLGEYLIDMERIDSPLSRVAHIDDVAAKISGERQILRFGVKDDNPCSVCPLVGDERFQKIRFSRTGLTDNHSVTILVQRSSLPQIENERIAVCFICA